MGRSGMIQENIKSPAEHLFIGICRHLMTPEEFGKIACFGV